MHPSFRNKISDPKQFVFYLQFDVSLFQREKERERERKRVSLFRNNFSLNWFNFNFYSETVRLCFNVLSKFELSCRIILLLSPTQWLLKDSLYVYPFFFTKIYFNLQFLCNTIKNMTTFESKNKRITIICYCVA